MTKTIPAIRAASACIKSRSGIQIWSGVGTCGLYPANRPDSAGPALEFCARYLSGAEAGANFDYGTAGALSFSYMWTNEYKAPWHIEMDDFYQNDKKTKVDYLHSVGAKYDFKNDLVLEAAFGQAQGYIDQYFCTKPATSLTSPARR